jgi:hypothetical protein
MEQLDRYLKHVKFWLPKAQRDDILAELSEELRSQVEEQESSRQRPLNAAEIADLLQKFGPPMLVAQRYLPQQSLIGPALFPMYRFVLKLVWTYVFAPWLIIGIALHIFASFGGGGPLRPAIQAMLEPFFNAFVVNFAAVTGIFALLEHYHAGSGLLNAASHRKIRPLRDLNRVRRSSSIGEFLWNFAFLLWWINVLHTPVIPLLDIKPAPIIQHALYWPILFLLAAQSAIAGFNAFRPLWTRRRAAIRAMADALGLFVVCPLLRIWISGESFITVINRKEGDDFWAAGIMFTWAWCVIILVWAAISYLIRLLQDVRRATGKPPIRNWALQLFAGE